MTAPVNFYADFKGLAALKSDAAAQDPEALREAARQFESLFTQMMLKSMRDATRSFSSGDSLIDSDQSDFYHEMFDSQMAVQLSKGKGLGLADMLVKQLQAVGIPGADGGRAGEPASSISLALPKRSQGIAAPVEVIESAVQRESGRTKEVLPVSDFPISESAPLPLFRSSALKTTASPAVSTAATPQPLATTPAEFVSQLWPHAETAARELGVDPRTLVAQAALETGWGKSVPCNPDGTCSFNLFGMKANSRWQGPSVSVNTLEFEDGVAVRRQASFRAYESPADSFRDYTSLIKSSPRYAAALGSGNDATAFATALQQGGYATDPKYAAKIAAIAERLGNLRGDLKSDSAQPLAFGRRVSTESGGET